jgi:hypothetical protein
MQNIANKADFDARKRIIEIILNDEPLFEEHIPDE